MTGVRVSEVTVKVGRKTGGPNFSSTTEEVTLTAVLGDGETPEVAVPVLRGRAQAILDGEGVLQPKVPDPNKDRKRISQQQRLQGEELLKRAKPALAKAKFGGNLALASDAVAKMKWADEADAALDALRKAMREEGLTA